MPSKKSAPRTAPKISSSATFSNSSVTNKQLNQSAILKHAFAPSSLQLNLFASVVQGLDAQVLRLHDTLTGKLRGEHLLGRGRISCLAWGSFGMTGSDDRPAKKRKTKDGAMEAAHDQADAVIAVGTFNSSNIELYCPAKAKVVSTLKGGHTQGVKDFKFLQDGRLHKAWSIGDEGKLVEWNTIDGSLIRSISLPSQVSPSNILLPAETHVLCAYSSVYSLDPEAPMDFFTFSGFSGNVHSLQVQKDRKDPSRIEAIIAAAESERNITVFDFEEQRIRGQMIASSAVERIAFPTSSGFQYDVLAVITEHGELELFENPFDFHDVDPAPAKSPKAARKAMTRRPKASIKITRPEKSTDQVAITSVEFEGSSLVLGWVESGAHPCFERIAWRGDDGAISLDGNVAIEKAKSQDVIKNAKMNGLEMGDPSVDDAQTVVVKGGDLVDSDGMELDAPEVSDSSSVKDGDDLSDDEDEQKAAFANAGAKRLTNGATANQDEDHMDAESSADSDEPKAERERQVERRGADEDGDEAAQAPSFGELLRAKAPGPVDVAAAFPAKAQTALVPQGEKSMDLPSGMSLATVLAQSLRTNDRDLLETCFHVQDLQVVRTTIERLDSALAGSLLERLAERLHNRPGRAGSLMVWIQWTLVAHGGYLAGQVRVVKQLRQLHSVVKERAQALQPLLLLKGKLDMLEAQMQLRRRAMERSRALQSAQEDDEEDAIYVEGQEEVDSEDEAEAMARQIGEAAAEDQEDIEFDSEDEEDDLRGALMDVDQDEDDDDDDDDEESEADENDLIDDEAEEDSADSGIEDDEEAVDYDDVDSLDEDEDEDGSSEADHQPTGKVKVKAKVNGIVKKIR